MTGIVKWFNNKKGYGFITNNDGEDIFVHYSGITSEKFYKTLKKGDKVTYITTMDTRGLLKAINVQTVEE